MLTSVQDKVLGLVKECLGSNEITADTVLTDAGMDSVTAISLMVRLETEFELLYNDDEMTLDNFSTVGKIAARIAQKKHLS